METKPAFYTTEFWVFVLGTIATVLNEFGAWDFVSNWHNGIIWVALAAAYQVSRGLAKSHTPVDPTLASTYRLVPRPSDGIKRV